MWSLITLSETNVKEKDFYIIWDSGFHHVIYSSYEAKAYF